MKEAKTHFSYYDVKRTPAMSGPWPNKRLQRRHNIIAAIVFGIIGAVVLFFSL